MPVFPLRHWMRINWRVTTPPRMEAFEPSLWSFWSLHFYSCPQGLTASPGCQQRRWQKLGLALPLLLDRTGCSHIMEWYISSSQTLFGRWWGVLVVLPYVGDYHIYLIMGILHLLLIASHCPGFLWTWARGSHCHFFVSWLSFLCHFTCLEAVTPLDWEDYSLPDHTNQSLRVLWDCPGGQVAPYFKWENVISIYKYKPTKKRCQSKKSPPFSDPAPLGRLGHMERLGETHPWRPDQQGSSDERSQDPG
jgi:hypothetical protein